VVSYRPFAEPKFAGMIYTDAYSGNTIEGGQESVAIDLVLRWRNQYYGGTNSAFWDLATRADMAKKIDRNLLAVGSRFPEVVSAFLKMALMRLPAEFPVRGPRAFNATEVIFEGAKFCGEWTYQNDWKGVPLFDTTDPFASYAGQEHISLNGTEVYWHAYHGGFVRDKYFPSVFAET
jgi:hypothetical protein